MADTTLILVRHGEAEGNIKRIFHGFTNSSLTENGHLQAACSAKYLKDMPIDVIYSSDLKRTMDTAEHIAGYHDLAVIPDARLREINGGKWEGVKWADLPEMFPDSYSVWENDIGNTKMPDGEDMHEFAKRVLTAVMDIINKHKGKTICIVSHGTAIRALLPAFYGKPVENMKDVPWCDNAAVTIVKHNETGFKMVLEGKNDHLGELSTMAKQNWWQKAAANKLK